MPRPQDEADLDVVRIVEGRRGTRRDADGAGAPLRLRPHRAVGAPRDGGISAVAGPDAVHLRTPVPLIGENLRTVAEFAVDAGAARAVRADLAPLARRRRPARRPLRRLEETERLVARLVRRCTYAGPGARRCGSRCIVAQGADLRADRRHRRRADDVAAGADRRRAQLGLPLLLAARRHVHALRPA